MAVEVDADLLVDDGAGGSRQLSVDDFGVGGTGAASEATLASALAALTAIAAELGQKFEAGGEVALSSATLAALEQVAVTGTVAVSNFPATQAVSAAALPLPDGAATATAQATANTALAGLLTELGQKLEPGDLAGLASDAVLAAVRDRLPAGGVASEAKLESVRALLAGSLAVSAVALPLPAGAATDAKSEAIRALLAGTLKVDASQLGTWGYKAGVSGTPTLTGKRVLKITASAPSSGAATITINGGDTITIPAGKTFGYELRGSVTAPTVVFTGTDAYFVETIG